MWGRADASGARTTWMPAGSEGMKTITNAAMVTRTVVTTTDTRTAACFEERNRLSGGNAANAYATVASMRAISDDHVLNVSIRPLPRAAGITENARFVEAKSPKAHASARSRSCP